MDVSALDANVLRKLKTPLLPRSPLPLKSLSSALKTSCAALGASLGCALLPAVCLFCGDPLTELSSTPICRECWLRIESAPPLTRGCLRCSEHLFSHGYAPDSESADLCRACRLAPPPFLQAISFGVYDDALRLAIHALKYEGMQSVGLPLGKLLAEAILRLGEDAPQCMLVVPVPLHQARSRQRGYNQARVLASEAIRTLRRSHPEWRLQLSSASLVRQRETEAQAGLSPRQRRLNVRGAFVVSDAAAVRDRHILLVDDILTTGATARACSQTLIEAGAASVRVVTLARAQLRSSHSDQAEWGENADDTELIQQEETPWLTPAWQIPDETARGDTGQPPQPG